MSQSPPSATIAQSLVTIKNFAINKTHNVSTVLVQTTHPNGSVGTQKNASTVVKITTLDQRNVLSILITVKLNYFKNDLE